MGVEAIAGPVLGTLVSSLVGSIISGGKKDSSAPAATEPAKAPAPSVAADSSLYKAANTASATSQGPSSTLLTGLGGVPNSSLNLGKNVVLGA